MEFMLLEPFETRQETIGMIGLLKGFLETGGGIRWVVTKASGGTVMGICGYHNWKRKRFRAEAGYERGKYFRGRGYMKEALSAMLTQGFEIMGLNRIEASVTDGNERSLGLLKNPGFEVEGLLCH